MAFKQSVWSLSGFFVALFGIFIEIFIWQPWPQVLFFKSSV